MNGRDVKQPKKPQRLINERRERLRKFIVVCKENPGLEFLVAEAASLYLSSFRWSWRVWWGNARFYAPRRLEWLVKLVDRDYAAVCKQVDDSE